MTYNRYNLILSRRRESTSFNIVENFHACLLDIKEKWKGQVILSGKKSEIRKAEDF
jgi:hypothetical protein